MLRIAALMTSILLALSAPASADVGDGMAPSEEILATLRDRGYRILEDERTWLGRQRIVAEKNGSRREVVFNPGTGEILRDYSFRLETGEGSGDTTVAGSGITGVEVGVSVGVAADPGLSVSDSVSDPVAGGSDDSNSRAQE